MNDAPQKSDGQRPPAVRGEVLWLACIVAMGGALRTYVWSHGYAQGGVHGLVRHGDGYLEMAAALAGQSAAGVFDHWRAYQFVYPVYLAPMFAFGLNDSAYVFWLHHLLAAATTVLLYLSARRLCGGGCGLLAALAYAAHLQAAYWFNWTLADTAFHCHLALFLLCVIESWRAPSPRSLILLIGAISLMCFTRPEGFVVAAAYATGVAFHALSRRMAWWKSAVVVAGAAACIAAASTAAIVINKPLREKVLSNVDLAWGLYYGSQRTPTRADVVDRMLIEMREYGAAMAAVDVERRSPWYWNSLAGLERIRRRPVQYVGYWAEREVNAFFPSFFREGVSLRYKLFDRTMSVFLLAGTALALAAIRGSNSAAPTIVLTAASIYALIGFMQSEWDVRVQLGPHILLIPVASLGWGWAFHQFRAGRTAGRVPSAHSA